MAEWLKALKRAYGARLLLEKRGERLHEADVTEGWPSG
jgi:hypothetical protein